MLESQLEGHILYDSICTKRVNEEMTKKVDESLLGLAAGQERRVVAL